MHFEEVTLILSRSILLRTHGRKSDVHDAVKPGGRWTAEKTHH